MCLRVFDQVVHVGLHDSICRSLRQRKDVFWCIFHTRIKAVALDTNSIDEEGSQFERHFRFGLSGTAIFLVFKA